VAKVIWTDKALAGLTAIVDWISKDRPRAAIRIAEKIMRAGDSLDRFPERGRAISRDRRELIVMAPYLIRYRVETSRVTILEVRHAARNPD
jgi:plasmid stabilization system protein ParE